MTQCHQVLLAVGTALSPRDDVMWIGGGNDLARMVAIWIHADRMGSKEHLAQTLPTSAVSAAGCCSTFLIILMAMRYKMLLTVATIPNQFDATWHKTWMERSTWHA